MKNGIMMQYFEWYLPDDGSLWDQAALAAKDLAKAGITALWLPPAYKGQQGNEDVGYGVYDLYDLGEFEQKGTTRTKYGTKKGYLKAISALHEAGITVYGDVVLNHMMGADETEVVKAREFDAANRNRQISGEEEVEVWTKFTFPGRRGKYSDFVWDHRDFDGVDWDQRTKRSSIYHFDGTDWDGEVDPENGNYDYLMGADLSFANERVRDHLAEWGQWYLDTTAVDGFRLDAVKHISFSFFDWWLGKLRKDNGKKLFAVGEYWSPEVERLTHYLEVCQGCMSLFDVPLHFHFFQASHSNGQYDMSGLLDHTLLGCDPEHAVTFVENHDTQAGQALETVVEDWFKPMAYAVILLRPQGYPCVFYGDYYGIPSHNEPSFQRDLDYMFTLRQTHMGGQQHDYFDHRDVVGWTFEGEGDSKEGMAVLINNGTEGQKRMYVGRKYCGMRFLDGIGHEKSEVWIDEEGFGQFPVGGGSWSVFLPV